MLLPAMCAAPAAFPSLGDTFYALAEAFGVWKEHVDYLGTPYCLTAHHEISSFALASHERLAVPKPTTDGPGFFLRGKRLKKLLAVFLILA